MDTAFSVKPIPKLIFGPGSLAGLPGILSQYGKRLLLVTGRSSFCKTHHWSDLQDTLEKKGFHYEQVQICREPTPKDIDTIVGEYADKGIDAVIAVGGGSVLDGGKAVSAMLRENRSVVLFLEGVGTETPTGDKVPFIAVPTTSGTGSEATANAVLRELGNNGFKKSLRHDRYVPDIALIDPLLTLSCPHRTTVACGMDAYTQLVEAYLSTNANPFTDSLALEGIQSLLPALRRAAADGNDLQARAGMAYGSYLSGIVLANAGLGTVHGFASAIGGFFDIPHGVVCGTLMAETNRASLRKLKAAGSNKTAMEKYTVLGKLTGIQNKAGDEQYPNLFIEDLQSLTSHLALPGLGDFGVTENDLARIAEKTGNKYNPVSFSRDELVAILSRRL